MQSKLALVISSFMLVAMSAESVAQSKMSSRHQGQGAYVNNNNPAPPLVIPPITIPPNNGGNPVTLPSPSGGSGSGAVTYSSSTPNICHVSGSTLTPISPGSCVITATMAASGVYGQASATATVSIPDVPQTALALNLIGVDLRDGPVTMPAATGGSGAMSITYVADGPCALDSLTLELRATGGEGDCRVTATNPANGFFRVASVQSTVSIRNRTQSALQVTLPTTWTNNVGTASVSGGSGGGDITWSSSNTAVCTVSGSGSSTQVTRVAAGTCNVMATKAADTALFYASASGSSPLTASADNFVTSCWTHATYGSGCGGGRVASREFIDSSLCRNAAVARESWGYVNSIYLTGSNGRYVRHGMAGSPQVTVGAFIDGGAAWDNYGGAGNNGTVNGGTMWLVCVQ